MSNLGNLELVRGNERHLAEALNDPASYRDGCFSRVVLHRGKTFKFTLCPATSALYQRLLRLDRPVRGLPVVYKQLPQVARFENAADSGNLLAYEVERLYDITDSRCHRKAARLRDELFAAVAREAYGEYPETDLELALRLARTLPALAETFTYLAHFISETGYVLDDIAARNVMVNARGELCLADPVAHHFREPQPTPPAGGLKLNWDFA